MRQLQALIVATALSAPSLALAAAPEEDVHRPAVTNATPAATLGESARAQAPAGVERQRASADDRARYAEREAQAGDAEKYRGGDTVVIGASAATAILAVLLVLVLI